MTKNIISALLLFCCGVFNLSAITIGTPGSLSSTLTDTSIDKLEISGSINAADLRFIAELDVDDDGAPVLKNLPNLVSLDLSKATVKECNDIFVGNGSIHAANTIPTGIFAGTPLKSIVLPSSDGLVILHGAFAGSALETVNIPSTVASVGDGAFAGCKSLKSAVIGANSLGKGVFSNCDALKTVEFTKPVDVPENAFYGCTSLETVKGDITAAGDRAFAKCPALTSISFSVIYAIGREAFMQSGLESVNLSGAPVESVGEWAFAMMPNLKSLNLGNASQMGQAVAFACPRLVEFKTAGVDLADFALTKSLAFESLTVPEGVENIGRYALSGLSGVKTVTLPSSLEMLDDHAMENMTALDTIYTNTTVVPALGEDVWAGVSQKDVTLTVPEIVIDDFKNADQWQNFNIISEETLSIDDVAGDSDLTNLRARIDGDDLIVETDGVEIDNLMIYNPAGQLLIAVEPMDSTIIVNIAGFGTRLYIIHAALADGRTASLKLAGN